MNCQRELVNGELLSFILTNIVFHSHLPLVVAEKLLRMDPQVKSPIWLVKVKEKTWGLTGQESNQALLFQLYVNYGR